MKKRPKITYKTYGYVGLGSDFTHWRDKHGNKVTPIHLEFNRPCRVKIVEEDGTVQHHDIELPPNQWKSRGLDKADAPRDRHDNIIVLRKKLATALQLDEIYTEPKPAPAPKDEIILTDEERENAAEDFVNNQSGTMTDSASKDFEESRTQQNEIEQPGSRFAK